MLIVLLPGEVPSILWLVLLLMVYLTFVELKDEPDLSIQWKLWWCSLVFMTNLLGYIAMRIWVALRRRDRARA